PSHSPVLSHPSSDPRTALDPSSGPAPDLIITITGSVLHGPTVMVPTDLSKTNTLEPRDHPRKFHEMFMLRAAEQGEGVQPKVSRGAVPSKVSSTDKLGLVRHP
ncbi:hypothetical protein P7C73_g6009, partial [Tremellales sp. Uapishka_1]